MNPKYPIYIISKGRAKTRLTSKSLEYMKVPYRIVVEPQEYDEYASVISPEKILTLPFSNLGQGSIPARNWVWEHSISEGHKRHWILDDNIRHFYRLNRNLKVRVTSGTIFKACEDFTDRYENVQMSGMNYHFFLARNLKYPPYYFNTRIYSCILLDNSVKHRWRGKFNEDTDLSLRILKDGSCTILFNAFLCGKQATLTMGGGNTEEVYNLNENEFDNRLKFAKSLHEQHPDVVKIIKRWGRWHHLVNYKKASFGNRLIKKENLNIAKGYDEYGMILRKMTKEEADGE